MSARTLFVTMPRAGEQVYHEPDLKMLDIIHKKVKLKERRTTIEGRKATLEEKKL